MDPGEGRAIFVPMSLRRRRWRRRAVPGLLLLVTALTLQAACSRAPYRHGLDPELVAQGPAGVLHEAAVRAGRVEAMRVTGTLQVRLDGGSLSGNIVLRYAAPDSFRFDVTAFMGTTIAQAVLTDGRARIWVPSERTVLEGEIDPEAMFEVNGFPLHPSMVHEWVLGPALARDWARLLDGVDRFDVGSDRVIIGIQRPDGHRMLFILGEDLVFRSAAFLDPLGQVLWQSRYSGWRRQRGALLPGNIEVSYPGAGLEVLFEVARRDLNPEASPDDFLLPVPPDARRRPIRQLRRGG